MDRDMKDLVELKSESLDRREVIGEILSRLSNIVGYVDIYVNKDMRVDLGFPMKDVNMLHPFDFIKYVIVSDEDIYLYGYVYIPLRDEKGTYGVLKLEENEYKDKKKDIQSYIYLLVDIFSEMFINNTWKADLDVFNKIHKINLELGKHRNLNELKMYLNTTMNEHLKNRDVEVDIREKSLINLKEDRREHIIYNLLRNKERVLRVKKTVLSEIDNEYMSGIVFSIYNKDYLQGYILVKSKTKECMTSEEIRLWRTVLNYVELLVSNIALLEDLERKNQRDGLTNLYNRSYMEERVKLYLENDEKGSFVLIDIDNFKRLNDTLGHLVGDQVLIQLARILEECVREEDFVARWGGEEIVIYLKDIKREDSIQVVNRIMRNIRERTKPRITVSGGHIHWNKESLNIKDYNEIFKEADDLLYDAKKNGKDRIEYMEM